MKAIAKCTSARATLRVGLPKNAVRSPFGANGAVGLNRVAAGLVPCEGLPRSAVRASWKYS
jgi:hypothetical protein